jgi:polysaccharide pyruvyl transferase WcaK-like protein
MDKQQVLVYGYYGKHNLGDELFKEAFQHLFPELHFIFTDHIVPEHLKDIETVFLGGGSLLLNRPDISEQSLAILQNKKIFYLGVGIEEKIDPIHLELMRQAKYIATRSGSKVPYIQEHINSNCEYVPDLVFSLPYVKNDYPPKGFEASNRVLIFPNIYTLPTHQSPHWQHAAWHYFKSEFAQFLDWLVENNYQPSLYSLSHNTTGSDTWAATELLSQMQYRDYQYISPFRLFNFQSIADLIAYSQVLITQRYHGMVLSEIANTPYVAISHHDKLQAFPTLNGEIIPYYGFNKQSLIDSFQRAAKKESTHTFPVNPTTFSALREKVISLI